ncbi:MAG: exo-alpha-sialidase [Anaerolineales bacterium]|nr:exo-alpha-sialidase [Anaerolineales bacterium]
MAKKRMQLWMTAGLSLALGLWLLMGSSGAAWAQDTTPTAEAGASATADSSLGIVAGDTWAPPANISRSGAASRPAIVADPAGNLHVLWWDNFAGTFYAKYSAETGWSSPVPVPQIFGGRPQTTTDQPAPYDELTLLADVNGFVHAFYRDARGNVMYSQARTDSGLWTQSIQLATSPLQWDVAVDAAGGLHLAYVRNIESDQLPAGVYYRQSTTRGADWQNTRVIQASLYFRALTSGNSFIDLSVPGNNQVLVTWDDPQLLQSFTATSNDNGFSFGEPVAVSGEQADQVRHAFLMVQADGTWLRLWSPPEGCGLFQQVSDAAHETWSAPVRVLEDVEGCLVRPQEYTLADGRLALFARLAGNTPLALVLWDGTRWSAPVTPRISFVDPATNHSTALACVAAVLVNDHVSVVGCDGAQDIWATTSRVTLPDLLPAVSTEWSPPLIISASEADAGLPGVAVDAEGRLHMLWAQGAVGGGGPETLAYARLEGEAGSGVWSGVGGVLQSPEGGTAQDPAVLIEPGGHMHALWSGGALGQLYYSRAFARDAAGSGGWEAVRTLTQGQGSGAWPALALGQAGELLGVYAVPLNEGRGVYFISSSDQGDSWTAPVQIFDAEAAEWPQVKQTSLAVDSAGRLHAAWVQGVLPPGETVLGVYYAYSDDDGQTWSAARVMAEGNAGYPSLAASSDGAVHLLWVTNPATTPELWHTRLPAGSDTWSEPIVVPGVREIGPQIGVVSDGQGGLHLVGVEGTASNSTVLFYLRWDGSAWGGRETIPLGYRMDQLSGARAIVRPQGLLGVVYRVYTVAGGGRRQYLAGYVERPVAPVAYQAAPTFTPPPEATARVTATPERTQTPAPTADLNVTPVPPLEGGNGIRVAGVLLGMVAVVAVALIGLRSRRG